MLYIGLDEAGYGPNLGPLVIGASAWSGPREIDPYTALASSVGRSIHEGRDRVMIADSKEIHSSQHGISRLEFQVLICRGLVYPAAGPTESQPFMDEWDASAAQSRQELPWYRDWDRTIPLAADVHEIPSRTAAFRHSLNAAGWQLRTLRVRSLEPAIFNAQVAMQGTKGRVLSVNTLELLREILDTESKCEPEISVVCDKHGGRNQYVPLLLDVLELPLVRALSESRESSRYCFGWNDAEVQIEFRTRGEAHLPTAMASMCAKYQRELAMSAWNQFWCRRMPQLRPTAGYPSDAKRFVAEIAHLLSEMRIAQDLYWRYR